MDSYSDLLLEIYRAARQLPPDEFPGALMALVRAVIGFDAARLLTTDLEGATAIVLGSTMFNIPAENPLDWQIVQGHDLVMPCALSHRGVPVSFNSPILFARPEHAVIRDYANRYGHQNGLCMVLDDPETGHTDGLSFYREDPDAYFELSEMRLVQALMPHLQQAVNLNRHLAMPFSTQGGALLIAQQDGAIHYCAREALGLLMAEWPGPQKARLPGPLLAALAKPGSHGFIGKQLTATGKLVANLLFLRIAPTPVLAALSPREWEVAQLYATGVAAKRIASKLSIAPATVRNLLHRIYQKLDVHDKASLANRIRQH